MFRFNEWIATASLSATACIVLGAVLVQPMAAMAETSANQLSGKVYLLSPNAQITRFEAYDAPAMRDSIARHAPGLELVVLSADNDPARQLEQAQAAVTEGAVAILLAPPVPNQSQSVVAVAQEAGIPVIGYAYNSDNSDIDYYVTVPFKPIGVTVAQYVVEDLKDREKPIQVALIEGDPSFFFDREQIAGMNEVFEPLVAAGEVNIVCRNDNLLLSEENARIAAEGCIEQADANLDAIVVHNDSSANGVIAALAAQGLLGEIKVYGGYDSQAGTIQHLLAGNIETNMVPPYAAMADTAIQLVVALLTESGAEETLVNGVYDNGFKAVPTVFNENVFITRDNVESALIDTGILTREEVCAGPALESELCRN